MNTPTEATPHGPEYRLFGANTVGIVAFLCGPLAGTILMAFNYVRLGKAGKGVLAVILGMISTALTILVRQPLAGLFCTFGLVHHLHLADRKAGARQVH